MRQLRDGGQPAAVSALDPFLTALAAAPIAASTLRWLQSPARHLVIALLDGRVPVTHAVLDAAAASRNHVVFLRAHLVSCGVLEERDEHSASFARWHQQAVVQIAPGADRAHVQAFARWQIAHELARARRPDRTAASTQKHSRCKVRQAIALTAWLHHQDLALADLRQDLLDAWVTDGASPRRTVRLFVAWLTRAGVTAQLDVTWNQRGPRPASLDERDRLYALRRLLEDESADPRDRLAGCLLLLYGQPFTRTAALRLTDITGVGGQACIRLGRGTLPLPPPMDTIARLVLESQPSNGDGWLFAGRHPGTHLTAEHLRVRVARYGLASITSRSSAILALAAQLPAPVLAERLGIHQSRAAAWARTAGQDYGSYVALRPELAQVQSAAVATVSTTGAR